MTKLLKRSPVIIGRAIVDFLAVLTILEALKTWEQGHTLRQLLRNDLPSAQAQREAAAFEVIHHKTRHLPTTVALANEALEAIFRAELSEMTDATTPRKEAS